MLKKFSILAALALSACAAPAMANDSVDANLNMSRCLVEKNNLGETLIYNVCNGTQKIIPWSTMDWASVLGLTAMIAILLLMFGGFVVAVIRS